MENRLGNVQSRREARVWKASDLSGVIRLWEKDWKIEENDTLYERGKAVGF